MPTEVTKEVSTDTSGPGLSSARQTVSTTQTPTGSELLDASANRGNAWIWYIAGVIDLLIALRLIFKLFGAHPVGFADFLYRITAPFVAPFTGIFPAPTVEGSYFETAALVAIVVYAIIAWIIARLIDVAARPTNSDKL
jgi:hypothetical protein